MGYPEITGVIAEKKFRNLRQTYKNIKDQKNKSGSGNIQWVWLEEFDDLFRRDVVHNPEGIIELGVQETRIPKKRTAVLENDSTPVAKRKAATPTNMEERRMAATERMLSLMEKMFERKKTNYVKPETVIECVTID